MFFLSIRGSSLWFNVVRCLLALRSPSGTMVPQACFSDDMVTVDTSSHSIFFWWNNKHWVSKRAEVCANSTSSACHAWDRINGFVFGNLTTHNIIFGHPDSSQYMISLTDRTKRPVMAGGFSSSSRSQQCATCACRAVDVQSWVRVGCHVVHVHTFHVQRCCDSRVIPYSLVRHGWIFVE